MFLHSNYFTFPKAIGFYARLTVDDDRAFPSKVSQTVGYLLINCTFLDGETMLGGSCVPPLLTYLDKDCFYN